MKIKVGKTYNVDHIYKGSFQCKIIYVGKIAIYAEITDVGTVWNEAKVKDHVRLTKRHVTFSSINQGE